MGAVWTMGKDSRADRASATVWLAALCVLAAMGILGTVQIFGQGSVSVARVTVRDEHGKGVESELTRILASGERLRMGKTDTNGERVFEPPRECKPGDLVQATSVSKGEYYLSRKKDVAMVVEFVLKRRPPAKSR